MIQVGIYTIFHTFYLFVKSFLMAFILVIFINYKNTNRSNFELVISKLLTIISTR